jgi:hypothetical protein
MFVYFFYSNLDFYFVKRKNVFDQLFFFFFFLLGYVNLKNLTPTHEHFMNDPLKHLNKKNIFLK